MGEGKGGGGAVCREGEGGKYFCSGPTFPTKSFSAYLEDLRGNSRT